jgi:hypothetical protein
MEKQEVEVGGLWQRPHLSMGYAQAARLLLASATQQEADLAEVGMPILFLMRHAIELALKDVLLAYDDIQASQAEIDAHDGKPTAAKPRPEPEINEVNSTHDLAKLLGSIKRWMPYYVTPNWDELVSEIERIERQAPERFRYDSVRTLNPATKKKEMVRSFEDLRKIPVGDLIGRLELFMTQAAAITPPAEMKDAIEVSALNDLGLQGQSITDQLYARGLL